MTSDYIPEARGRLDAARDYINEFKRIFDAYFSSQPYAIVTEEELKGDIKIIRYRFIVQREIPSGLRVPVRACIAELRDILDNLVWGLSQAFEASPSCDIDFPIYLTEVAAPRKGQAFDAWVGKYKTILNKCPAGTEAFIRSLQPFNPYKGDQVGASHPIYILNKLAVQNKHKVALAITGVHMNDVVSLRPGWTFDGTVKHPPDVFEHNAIILEIPVPASKPPGDLEFKIATQIAFDKRGAAGGAEVYHFLIDMHDFIRDEVIAKFEPFFPK